MIQLNKKNIRLLEGDFKPASGYVGDKKAGGWETDTASGQGLEIEDTYNSTYDEMKVYGKSEQKADWSQAEGETSQAVTEQGENLLDLERLEGNLFTYQSELTSLENGYIFKAVSGTANQYAWQTNANPIKLDLDTDYTLSFDFEILQGTSEYIGVGIAKNYSGSGSIDYLARVYCSSNKTYYFNFNSGEYKNVYLYFIVNADTTTGIFEEKITNIQLLKGTYTEETLPDYEPFVPDSPSPEYPSEMTSVIPAGSYQIPTENGIYEVTLTEDLYGIDDTYRNMIRFDSVSGKGYLEINTSKTMLSSSDNWGKSSVTGWNVYYNLKIQTDVLKPANNDTSIRVMSDKLKSYSGGYNGLYQWNNSVAVSSDGAIGIKIDDTVTTLDELKALLDTCGGIEMLYPLLTPLKTSLTFTKVESSTAPVLPWTAYGENLFDLESLEGTLGGGNGAKAIDLKNGFRLEVISDQGNRYAWQNNINPIRLEPNTDYTVIFDFQNLTVPNTGLFGLCKTYRDSGQNAIYHVRITCGSNGRYFKQFNSGEYELLYLVMSVQNSATEDRAIQEYTNIQLLKGSYTEETLPDYESFDSTPPESLSLSPYYPRQIYSLTDVTVTSRGRNLFNAEDWYTFLRSYTTTFVSKATLDGYECIKYHPEGTYDKPYMRGQFKPNTQYTIKFKGRQDAVHEGNSSGFMFQYTDGTSMSLYVDNTTEWKEYIATSAAGKTIDYIKMGYNYGYPIYIVENSIQLVEEAYTAETIPVCDRYRCTSAEIPLALSSVPQGDGEINDVVQSDTSVKHTRNISEKVFTGAEEVVWTSAVDTATGKIDFSVLASGIMTEQEFQLVCSHFEYAESQNLKIPCIYRFQNNQYLYFRMLASDLEITEADDNSAKKTKIKAWFAKQNELGMPVTVLYALETPTQTDYSSQDWGEDMLSLRTAPYYTELFTDKETGGIDITYKTFNGGE